MITIKRREEKHHSTLFTFIIFYLQRNKILPRYRFLLHKFFFIALFVPTREVNNLIKLKLIKFFFYFKDVQQIYHLCDNIKDY